MASLRDGRVMSARHRVSKLLLRHGIVYYDGRPWTTRHDHWLRSQRLAQPGTQLGFDSAYDGSSLFPVGYLA